MARKVIYVALGPLTERIAREWFLDFLIERGLRVEYWNLSRLVGGIAGEHGEKKAGCVREFDSWAALQAAAARPENAGAVCVMLMGYGGRFIPVYRLLSRYGCRMVYLTFGALPERNHRRWRVRRFEVANPWRLARRIFDKLRAVGYLRLGLVKPYAAVFAAGPMLESGAFCTEKWVPINGFDYDKFQAAKRSQERPATGSYAVFLDIFLPYQSDLKFEGGVRIDAETYYASLNGFFARVERIFGVRVVVAAHPKARYDAARFEGREIHSGKTAELVRDCRFAIAHHSGSVNFAVLARVPVVFVYTQPMLDLYADTRVASIRDIAGYLGARVCNIDAIAADDQVEMSEVDEAVYDKFVQTYLAGAPTEVRMTQDIFLAEVMRLLGGRDDGTAPCPGGVACGAGHGE